MYTTHHTQYDDVSNQQFPIPFTFPLLTATVMSQVDRIPFTNKECKCPYTTSNYGICTPAYNFYPSGVGIYILVHGL